MIRKHQREDFDSKIKDKEIQLEKSEHERLMAVKQMEEDEVRKLRKQMVFRASKIRKYRFVMSGDSQKPRALTVPLPPKLHTAERAQLKDDLIVCSQ